MTTSIITPKIYVSVLADYNNGRMHGSWIDCDQSVEAVWQEIHHLYITSSDPNVNATVCQDCGHIKLYEHNICNDCGSENTRLVPSAEEYAIHDHEGFAPFNVSEYSSIEEVVRMAEILNNDNDPDHVALDFLVNHLNYDLDDIESKLDDVCIFTGSRSDYAEELTAECGREVPDWLSYYIDYDAMGRDMEINGEIVEISHHVYVTGSQDL